MDYLLVRLPVFGCLFMVVTTVALGAVIGVIVGVVWVGEHVGLWG